MLRFLFTRRWLGLLLAVLVVGGVCVELGLWQFRRYADRHDDNARITANLHAAPAPVDSVLSPGAPPSTADEWRVVTARGSYDAAHQLAVLYRTRAGSPGVDVVVPLVTASGAALLVDRGWVPTARSVDTTAALPAPPPGVVTVTGWVRRNASGGADETAPSEGSVRAISATAVADVVPYDLYDGFIELTGEQPPASRSPAKATPPDLGSGPHFFYGLQWFFFAVLALGFWGYFAWTEYKRELSGGQPTSKRPGDPTVDRQQRAGDVAGRR